MTTTLTTDVTVPDVSRELWKLLRSASTRVERALKRCERDLGERNVHQIRVQIRRLISLLNLIKVLGSSKKVARAERTLQKLRRRFSKLRDTHVQMAQIERAMTRWTRLEIVARALRQREKRLTRRAQSRVRQISLKPLREDLARIQQRLRKADREAGKERQRWSAFLGATEKAFNAVRTARGSIRPSAPSSVHRMRVAFKTFRYMVVELQSLLPGLSPAQLEEMASFQSLMGEIQDQSVMLEALRKFRKKKPKAAQAVRAWQREIHRRQRLLVHEVLGKSDALESLWTTNLKSTRANPSTQPR